LGKGGEGGAVGAVEDEASGEVGLDDIVGGEGGSGEGSDDALDVIIMMRRKMQMES